MDETKQSHRGDQILLLVYCRDVCAICLLADNLWMKMSAHAIQHHIGTHRNAVWVLLPDALCLSLALLLSQEDWCQM